jgi:hypothetical protein
MRGSIIGLAIAGALAGGAWAAELTPALQPLGFLVGHWEGGGPVSDTGGRAHGVSAITVEADGRALWRNDRNETFDKSGKPTGGFGQVMLIYPEAGGVKADYVDGEGHVIHYGPAVIVAGRSVEFTSIAPASAPTFRLLYETEGADTLKISFTFRPPGGTTFLPIAVGEVHRVK